MSFTISAASISQMNPLDVHYLYKLRVDVFVHEQQCPYAEIDPTDVRSDTLHLLARDEAGDLVGTCRVFPSRHGGEDVMQFGRFALAPAARGTGLGHHIMEAALQLCEHVAAGLPVFLEAQAPLTDYYGAFGFVPCGEEFDDEGIPHVPMLRRPAPPA